MKLFYEISKVFHGTLFGVGTGLILGIAFVQMKVPHQHGVELIVIGVPLACAILGGVFGGVFAFLNRRSKRVSIVVATIAYLYIIGAFVANSYDHYRASQTRERRELEVREMATALNASYDSFYLRSEESVPALLGPLLYPGSRLLEWPPGDSFDGFRWTINLESDDTLEKVLGHYMAILPEGLVVVNGRSFRSQPQASMDGRTTTLQVEEAGDHTWIRVRTKFLRTSGPLVAEGVSLPVAWPEDEATRRTQVAGHQRSRREYIERLLGPMLYPDARSLVTSFEGEDNATFGFPKAVFICDAAWPQIMEHLSRNLELSAQEQNSADFNKIVTDDNGAQLKIAVFARAPTDARNPFDGTAMICMAWPIG